MIPGVYRRAATPNLIAGAVHMSKSEHVPVSTGLYEPDKQDPERAAVCRERDQSSQTSYSYGVHF